MDAITKETRAIRINAKAVCLLNVRVYMWMAFDADEYGPFACGGHLWRNICVLYVFWSRRAVIRESGRFPKDGSEISLRLCV